MLNWRIEEDEYANNKRLEYLDKLSAFSQIILFHNQKKMNKIMGEIDTRARLEYRKNKLDDFIEEVEQERKRINDLVDDLNDKFDAYMKKQQNIISKNIKPFEIKVKSYNNPSKITLEQLEVVTINCEPLKLSFIQEKVGEIE